VSTDVLLRSRVGRVPSGSPRRLDPDRVADHLDRLFRAAWAMCGDPHDGEDLVQDTYARVLARPRFLRHDDDLGYLLRALRNTHVSRLRRAGRRPVEVRSDEDAAGPDAFDVRRPEMAFEVGQLFAVIATLPDDAREAIVAVDVAGLSYREAADALRVKEATLTTRLHRARRRVARLMADDEPRSQAS
jgi:RNA polymerase sigma-70 factor (ECF subfamily)